MKECKICAVVNADDFGINENQTLAICDAFQMGLLTQTTAMVNMPWFDKSVKLAKDNGFFHRVGLHFNLTEGKALTQIMRECPFFCDNDGNFTGNFHRSLKSRLFITGKLESVLQAEVEAQLQRYIAAGYTMMHLDSHHHVHTDFSVARVLLPIAKKYGFKTCRLSRTISCRRVSMPKTLYKSIYNRYVRKFLKVSVDEFTDFTDFSASCMSLSTGCRVEVMVHPGLSLDPTLESQQAFWKIANEKGIIISHD